MKHRPFVIVPLAAILLAVAPSAHAAQTAEGCEAAKLKAAGKAAAQLLK